MIITAYDAKGYTVGMLSCNESSRYVICERSVITQRQQLFSNWDMLSAEPGGRIEIS